jgi:hypothetical protein
MNKNKKLAILFMACVLVFGIGIGVYAASDIRLFINGKQIDSDIQVINGSSYVPLRVVSEALGADVKWDEVNRTINIKKTKTYEVNAAIWSGTLMMKISNITLDTAFQNDKTTHSINAIIFDVSIENTGYVGYSYLKWYPTKGKIRLNNNTTVEISNPSGYSDDLDGSFSSKQVKKGKIVVQVSSNLDDIKTIDFMIDGSTDGHIYNVVEAKQIELK